MKNEALKQAMSSVKSLFVVRRVDPRDDGPTRSRAWCWEDRLDGETKHAHQARLEESRVRSMLYMRFGSVGATLLVGMLT